MREENGTKEWHWVWIRREQDLDTHTSKLIFKENRRRWRGKASMGLTWAGRRKYTVTVWPEIILYWKPFTCPLEHIQLPFVLTSLSSIEWTGNSLFWLSFWISRLKIFWDYFYCHTLWNMCLPKPQMELSNAKVETWQPHLGQANSWHYTISCLFCEKVLHTLCWMTWK